MRQNLAPHLRVLTRHRRFVVVVEAVPFAHEVQAQRHRQPEFLRPVEDGTVAHRPVAHRVAAVPLE